MPFNRKSFDKQQYRWVYSFSRGWKPEHVIVAEAKEGRLFSRSDGFHVHHVNFVGDDNRHENLRVMPAKEHLAFHARINNRRFEQPAARKVQAEHARRRWMLGGDLPAQEPRRSLSQPDACAVCGKPGLDLGETAHPECRERGSK